MLKRIIILCVLLFAHPAFAQGMSRGAYLARLGDCTSCHTRPGGKPYAGGFPVHSPFGDIYGANITPDKEYGIGSWSLKDFTLTLREGVAKDGTHLYPAMPYPSFSKMSDDDIKALYDYFMNEVAPVHEKSPETRLPFPFNQRWTLALWNLAFLKNERYVPSQDRDAAWNRGAYLVQGPAHCGACHTPRGPAFEELAYSESSSSFLKGEVLDHWFAPSLHADMASGLGRWSEQDIATFLGTGQGAGTIVFGSMKEVVENSGQYMTPEDRAAIAHYLKSLKASGEVATYHHNQRPDDFEHPGAGLYANFCSKCHGADGEGKLPHVPQLADNSAVLSGDATSVIRIVLEGSSAPRLQEKKPPHMPGFQRRFTDEEIANVINFIRTAWGNDAPLTTGRQVTKLRKKLAQEPVAASTPAQASSTHQ